MNVDDKTNNRIIICKACGYGRDPEDGEGWHEHQQHTALTKAYQRDEE